MRAMTWALCSVALLLPLSARAQERVEQRLQRFHFSDPAYLQEPQALQLSVGSYWRDREGEGNFTVPLELQFGGSKRVEFDGEVELAFPKASSGSLRAVDRAEVGATLGLLDDGARGVALSVGVGFVGSRDPLDDSFDPGAAPHFLAYVQRGKLLANLQLSIDLISRNDALDASPEAALGLALDLGAVKPIFEALYTNEEEPAGTFALGLRFQPVKSLELGAAVPLEVSEGDAHLGVIGQIIWELGGS
jgi:hypothetical protein